MNRLNDRLYPLTDRDPERILRYSPFCLPSVMIRARRLDDPAFDVDLDPAEDIDLAMRLGMKGKLANLPEPLYRIRTHPGSVTQADPRDGEEDVPDPPEGRARVRLPGDACRPRLERCPVRHHVRHARIVAVLALQQDAGEHDEWRRADGRVSQPLSGQRLRESLHRGGHAERLPGAWLRRRRVQAGPAARRVPDDPPPAGLHHLQPLSLPKTAGLRASPQLEEAARARAPHQDRLLDLAVPAEADQRGSEHEGRRRGETSGQGGPARRPLLPRRRPGRPAHGGLRGVRRSGIRDCSARRRPRSDAPEPDPRYAADISFIGANLPTKRQVHR